MRLIGTIVRLQVQDSSLKVGAKPRRYDPAPIRSVPALRLSPAGVVGRAEDGESILDVHHHDHPASKNRDGENGISLGFTAHSVQSDSGSVSILPDGIAGENILIEADRQFLVDDLAAGVVIEGNARAAAGTTDRDRRRSLRRVFPLRPEFPRWRSAGRNGDGGAALSRCGDARLLCYLRR